MVQDNTDKQLYFSSLAFLLNQIEEIFLRFQVTEQLKYA